MFKRILTVSGFTLLSRISGFARDIVLAAVLGAGPVADAFFVALRLPNHFRAIFAEGAFNAAFLPTYARLRTASGPAIVDVFAGRIVSLVLIVQLIFLAIALFHAPWVISLLAPGFAKNSDKFDLAVDLTRITFPYLLLISLVTLYGGILNALNRFAAAAAAPILLNVAIILALAVGAMFPTPGHAAAWGVFAAGILEVLLVGFDAWRKGVLPRPRWPTFDVDVKTFLKRFGPATVGSAESQIAMFADTIIASFLVTGALSSLYYADRLNQLPIGLIAVAIGTVLLPEMANRLAAGDENGARYAQNRAVEFTLLCCIPFFVAFLLVPELIMNGLFGRGKFTATDAAATGETLRAYAIGLPAFVLLRSVAITFLSRGDTWTPVKALFFAVMVNVGFKVLLFDTLAQVGLAFATSVGAWVNITLLWWFAVRQKLLTFDAQLKRSVIRLTGAGVILAVALIVGERMLDKLFSDWTSFRAEAKLAALVGIGAVVYSGAVVLLLGRRRLAAFMTRGRTPKKPAQSDIDEQN